MKRFIAFITFCTLPVLLEGQTKTYKEYQNYINRYYDNAERCSTAADWEVTVQKGIDDVKQKWEQDILINGIKGENSADLKINFNTELFADYQRRKAEWLADNADLSPAVITESAILKIISDIRNMTDSLPAEEALIVWNNEWNTRIEKMINDSKEISDNKKLLLLESLKNESNSLITKVSENTDLRINAINSRNNILAENLFNSNTNSYFYTKLFDTQSLRRQSDNESASSIAENIISETSAVAEEIKAGLNETNFSDESFQKISSSIETGLSQWKNAEQKLVMERLQWEKSSADAATKNSDEWSKAYQELINQREKWLQEINQQISEGGTLWLKVKEQKNTEYDKALIDLNSYINLQKNEWDDYTVGINRILQTGSSSINTAVNNLSWLQRFRDELVSAGNSSLADNINSQIAEWNNIIASYNNLMNNSSGEFSVNSVGDYFHLNNGNVMNDTYLMTKAEYDLKILSVQKQYWNERLQKAQAVYDYSVNEIDRPSAANQSANLESAKNLYDSKLLEYQNELNNLNSIVLPALNNAQTNLSAIAVDLEAAKKSFEAVQNKYKEVSTIASYLLSQDSVELAKSEIKKANTELAELSNRINDTEQKWLTVSKNYFAANTLADRNKEMITYGEKIRKHYLYAIGTNEESGYYRLKNLYDKEWESSGNLDDKIVHFNELMDSDYYYKKIMFAGEIPPENLTDIQNLIEDTKDDYSAKFSQYLSNKTDPQLGLKSKIDLIKTIVSMEKLFDTASQSSFHTIKYLLTNYNSISEIDNSDYSIKNINIRLEKQIDNNTKLFYKNSYDQLGAVNQLVNNLEYTPGLYNDLLDELNSRIDSMPINSFSSDELLSLVSVYDFISANSDALSGGENSFDEFKTGIQKSINSFNSVNLFLNEDYLNSDDDYVIAEGLRIMLENDEVWLSNGKYVWNKNNADTVTVLNDTEKNSLLAIYSFLTNPQNYEIFDKSIICSKEESELKSLEIIRNFAAENYSTSSENIVRSKSLSFTEKIKNYFGITDLSNIEKGSISFSKLKEYSENILKMKNSNSYLPTSITIALNDISKALEKMNAARIIYERNNESLSIVDSEILEKENLLNKLDEINSIMGNFIIDTGKGDALTNDEKIVLAKNAAQYLADNESAIRGLSSNDTNGLYEAINNLFLADESATLEKAEELISFIETSFTNDSENGLSSAIKNQYRKTMSGVNELTSLKDFITYNKSGFVYRRDFLYKLFSTEEDMAGKNVLSVNEVSSFYNVDDMISDNIQTGTISYYNNLTDKSYFNNILDTMSNLNKALVNIIFSAGSEDTASKDLQISNNGVIYNITTPFNNGFAGYGFVDRYEAVNIFNTMMTTNGDYNQPVNTLNAIITSQKNNAVIQEIETNSTNNYNETVSQQIMLLDKITQYNKILSKTSITDYMNSAEYVDVKNQFIVKKSEYEQSQNNFNAAQTAYSIERNKYFNQLNIISGLYEAAEEKRVKKEIEEAVYDYAKTSYLYSNENRADSPSLPESGKADALNELNFSKNIHEEYLKKYYDQNNIVEQEKLLNINNESDYTAAKNSLIDDSQRALKIEKLGYAFKAEMEQKLYAYEKAKEAYEDERNVFLQVNTVDGMTDEEIENLTSNRNKIIDMLIQKKFLDNSTRLDELLDPHIILFVVSQNDVTNISPNGKAFEKDIIAASHYYNKKVLDDKILYGNTILSLGFDDESGNEIISAESPLFYYLDSLDKGLIQENASLNSIFESYLYYAENYNKFIASDLKWFGVSARYDDKHKIYKKIKNSGDNIFERALAKTAAVAFATVSGLWLDKLLLSTLASSVEKYKNKVDTHKKNYETNFKKFKAQTAKISAAKKNFLNAQNELAYFTQIENFEGQSYIDPETLSARTSLMNLYREISDKYGLNLSDDDFRYLKENGLSDGINASSYKTSEKVFDSNGYEVCTKSFLDSAKISESYFSFLESKRQTSFNNYLWTSDQLKNKNYDAKTIFKEKESVVYDLLNLKNSENIFSVKISNKMLDSYIINCIEYFSVLEGFSKEQIDSLRQNRNNREGMLNMFSEYSKNTKGINDLELDQKKNLQLSVWEVLKSYFNDEETRWNKKVLSVFERGIRQWRNMEDSFLQRKAQSENDLARTIRDKEKDFIAVVNELNIRKEDWLYKTTETQLSDEDYSSLSLNMQSMLQRISEISGNDKYSFNAANELDKILKERPDIITDEIKKISEISKRDFVNNIASGNSRTDFSGSFNTITKQFEDLSRRTNNLKLLQSLSLLQKQMEDSLRNMNNNAEQIARNYAAAMNYSSSKGKYTRSGKNQIGIDVIREVTAYKDFKYKVNNLMPSEYEDINGKTNGMETFEIENYVNIGMFQMKKNFEKITTDFNLHRGSFSDFKYDNNGIETKIKQGGEFGRIADEIADNEKADAKFDRNLAIANSLIALGLSIINPALGFAYTAYSQLDKVIDNQINMKSYLLSTAISGGTAFVGGAIFSNGTLTDIAAGQSLNYAASGAKVDAKGGVDYKLTQQDSIGAGIGLAGTGLAIAAGSTATGTMIGQKSTRVLTNTAVGTFQSGITYNSKGDYKGFDYTASGVGGNLITGTTSMLLAQSNFYNNSNDQFKRFTSVTLNNFINGGASLVNKNFKDNISSNYNYSIEEYGAMAGNNISAIVETQESFPENREKESAPMNTVDAMAAALWTGFRKTKEVIAVITTAVTGGVAAGTAKGAAVLGDAGNLIGGYAAKAYGIISPYLHDAAAMIKNSAVNTWEKASNWIDHGIYETDQEEYDRIFSENRDDILNNFSTDSRSDTDSKIQNLKDLGYDTTEIEAEIAKRRTALVKRTVQVLSSPVEVVQDNPYKIINEVNGSNGYFNPGRLSLDGLFSSEEDKTVSINVPDYMLSASRELYQMDTGVVDGMRDNVPIKTSEEYKKAYQLLDDNFKAETGLTEETFVAGKNTGCVAISLYKSLVASGAQVGSLSDFLVNGINKGHIKATDSFIFDKEALAKSYNKELIQLESPTTNDIKEIYNTLNPSNVVIRSDGHSFNSYNDDGNIKIADQGNWSKTGKLLEDHYSNRNIQYCYYLK